MVWSLAALRYVLRIKFPLYLHENYFPWPVFYENLFDLEGEAGGWGKKDKGGWDRGKEYLLEF